MIVHSNPRRPGPRIASFLWCGVFALLLAACTSNTPRDERGHRQLGLRLSEEAQITKDNFLQVDPGLREFFDDSHGYVIFPTIGKGGLLVGAAYGEGCVYEQGELIGYAELSQGTIGLQLGGQSFSEVIFFKYKSALDRFKEGDLKFSANASAVAASRGASAAADYESGVAVFTLARGGLMVEASIGGQRFSYEPR